MRWLAAFALLLMSAPAQASPLIADVSTYEILINSGFTGARVLLFGARNEGGDVVVVVRGPDKNYTVRKKERVAGMWLNTESAAFAGLPSFYAVGGSRPLGDIRSGQMFPGLKIGAESMLDARSAKASEGVDVPSFAEALMTYQQKKNLYAPTVHLQFMGETLFKAVIDFPDTISEGDYTAEAYLFSGGTLSGVQTVPITVRKTGFDAFVHGAAHRFPALYGLLAIALAALAGWLASRVFEKI